MGMNSREFVPSRRVHFQRFHCGMQLVPEQGLEVVPQAIVDLLLTQCPYQLGVLLVDQWMLAGWMDAQQLSQIDLAKASCSCLQTQQMIGLLEEIQSYPQR